MIFRTLLLSSLALATASVHAQMGNTIYNNAVPAGLTSWGFVTGPRLPSGYYSEVQAPNVALGASIGNATSRVGDDYVVGGNGVFVDSIAVFAAVFDNTSPLALMTGGAMEIRSGSVNGTVVGTGTFDFATSTSIYRHATGAPNSNYQVQRIMFNFPQVYLKPGTYWITYNVSNSAIPTVLAPFLTKVGSPTTPGANARFQSAAAGWNPIVDSGNPQDLPFWVQGSDCVAKLFTYDTTSRNFSEIGPYTLTSDITFTNPAGFATLGSFTYDHVRETLFASSTSTHQLFAGDWTGNLVPRGTYGVGTPFMHGIEYNEDNGFIYGVGSASGGNNLYRINPGSGAATLLGSTGIGGTGFRALAYVTATNQMFLADTSTDSLYTVNLTTGAATFVGLLNGPTNVSGMAYSPDTNALYAIEGNGTLWSVNRTNGASTLLGDIGTGNFLGLVHKPDDVLSSSTPYVSSGTAFGGNGDSLKESDDDKFYVLNDENEPNCSLLTLGNFCLRNLTRLYIRVEFSATRDDLSLFIDVQNHVANSYDNAYQTTTTLSDQTINIVRTGTQWASDTRFSSIRIRTIPQTDLESGDGWATAIDVARLRAAL